MTRISTRSDTPSRSSEGKETSVRLLVERARVGDERAFRNLMSDHEDALYALARRYLGSHHDADDVLQDAFVKIFQNLDGLSSPEAFYSWCRRIVVNTALDHIRRRRRCVEIEEDGLAAASVSSPRVFAPPDRRVEEREFIACLERALRSLPPRQREVVVLHDVEGLSTEEVAVRCDCPPATVRSNLFYGREKLRSALARFR